MSAKRCTTHHHACDCREAEIARLLRDVMASHADGSGPHYSGCDQDPCAWCVAARRVLGETANPVGAD